MSLGQFINGGGPVLIIILLLAAVGLLFFFERLFVFLKEQAELKVLSVKVRNAVAQKNLTAARQHCRTSFGVFSSVMLKAFEYYDQGKINEFDGILQALVEDEAIRVEKNFRYINMTVVLAPLLGFFGTVIGMVQVFSGIQKVGGLQGLQGQASLAQGISVALYTTIGGLAVAIPMTLLMTVLREFEDRVINKTVDEARTTVLKLRALPPEEVQ